MHARVPQKGALLHTGKNIRSTSTEPHADRRPTYNGVQPGSPRGPFAFNTEPFQVKPTW